MFDIRTKISPRLKACRADKGWTFKETVERLSRITGEKIIPSRYGNWELAINTPPLELLIAMGRLFDKPSAYLAGLTDDDGTAPESSLYTVPSAEPLATSAGIINLADDALAFRRTYLEDHKLSRDKILLVTAPDDSMTPTIFKGDRVLVDMADTKVWRDDMFAIVVNGRLWLRWIRQNLDGTYNVQAENRERYPDDVVSADQLQDLHILGRVRIITHAR